MGELAKALEGGTGLDLPDRIITAIDLNEDGSLSKDELVAFMSKMAEACGMTDRDDDDHAREAGRICRDMGDGSCVPAAKFREFLEGLPQDKAEELAKALEGK